MENAEEDDDLKLVKASGRLLAELEDALPKILWKPAKSGNGRKVHTRVRQRDLDHVLRLIEPFQSEPQLLDARLKRFLPPIVEAYLAYTQVKDTRLSQEHLDLQTAVCNLLYTFCKVRGYKVVLGFLNNEPKYLETILLQLEAVISHNTQQSSAWQVCYVLLLWLSHLLLTPFDLASISDQTVEDEQTSALQWIPRLPSVARRTLAVGLSFLLTSTKAQDAAAMLIARLIRRPDMQRLSLADSVTAKMLESLRESDSVASTTVYERLGPLRLLSGVAASSELSHLIPDVYTACQRHSEDAASFIANNAVAKKLVVKILRDVAISSLRTSDPKGPLLGFFETTSVLEDVIDYLLRSLSDRDTPVRFAAAKAISLIVLELDAEMREDVIQAVLDTFKEDMSRSSEQKLDFRTANVLKWHGLTLCLAHTLFKRSASPDQLQDIVEALTSALQFEQRTATGSTVGTNVRDAANFGIWSLSRRYTTDELLSVRANNCSSGSVRSESTTVIQHLAIELVLSACLDPSGNVRRGSSAALQELTGRHPNEVKEGIALVQTVDYQAVGLRRRAMVEVSVRATKLETSYFQPVRTALTEWRGLGAVDATSREAAALALAKLTGQGHYQGDAIVGEVLQHARTFHFGDYEFLHGLASAMANIFEKALGLEYGSGLLAATSDVMQSSFSVLLRHLESSTKDFSPRMLRSELPSAIAKMLAGYCAFQAERFRFPELPSASAPQSFIDFDLLETLSTRLLDRGEESIREAMPPLVRSLLVLKRKFHQPLGILGSQVLVKEVAIVGAKSTLHSAGRVMTLGALAPLYGSGLQDEKATKVVSTLGSLTQAMAVDWRIIGIRALQLAVEGVEQENKMEPAILDSIGSAVHVGMNDYTVDERGDIGSLVRLQAVACSSILFAKCCTDRAIPDQDPLQILQADVLRLSLEKLDRVRLAAAQCQSRHITAQLSVQDIAAVSSYKYFESQFRPLVSPTEPDWKHRALLSGAMSAAGISAEPLLQASRAALAATMRSCLDEHLCHLMTLYTGILKASLASPTSPITTPALTLLAFLLDTQILARLGVSNLTPRPTFRWLALLSAVQKSHHKSNDILKIAAAVAVYRSLAGVEVIRTEVLKKLLSMLRTNPYPRVRGLVAEVLFVVVGDQDDEVRRMLKKGDWMGERKMNEGVVREVEGRLLGTELMS